MSFLRTHFHTASLLVLSIFLSAALAFTQDSHATQDSFASHLQKAKKYLDEKRPDLAIPELQAASAIEPNNFETQANLGVLLYFQGKSDDAIPHLRAAVNAQPGLGNIQGLLGLAEVRNRDFQQGRMDLETAFPLISEPKFQIEVGLELVSLQTQAGDLDQAGSVVSQLRKVAPDNPEVLYAAYRTYSDLMGESMLALSIAAPDSAQMHQILAHEQNRQGNAAGAIEQLRKAIALNPHLPGAHFELAELLHLSQDDAAKKQAEPEYRAALKDNPQDEKAILRFAEIDAEKGNIPESFKGYTRAIELQPSDADAKLGLAKTLIAMNESGKALKLLEETVQLDPTNATAHYRLGSMYRELGRAEDSKKEIELYKKYKDMKEKLQALYKQLQIQPKEVSVDEPDQK
jgi:tetratricopeptide (TPR) repeat protein